MAQARCLNHFVALAILCSIARSQLTTRTTNGGARNGGFTNESGTPSVTSDSPVSTTAAPVESTTAIIVVPPFIYSAVDSVMTHYFPSTMPDVLASITWPSRVVIGTATYRLPTESTPKSASPIDPDQRSRSRDHSVDGGNDKNLAIILGVVIGSVALAIVALAFCCLARRRKKTGSFFMRRRSMLSTRSAASRRFGGCGNDSYFESSQPNMSGIHRESHPACLLPGVIHHQSSRSTSDDDIPFYTPLQQLSSCFDHYELADQRRSERDYQERAHRRSSGSFPEDRPPTPFSPAMMLQPTRQSQPQPPQSPFFAPEDNEAEDIVSPILPAKSFERRPHMVHYPSMDEVSEFNFSGKRKKRRSSSDSISMWKRENERTDGRYEMA